MELNIRTYIHNNFKNTTTTILKESITESITKGEEITLPGLGVFFELLWNQSPPAKQAEILEILKASF